MSQLPSIVIGTVVKLLHPFCWATPRFPVPCVHGFFDGAPHEQAQTSLDGRVTCSTMVGAS